MPPGIPRRRSLAQGMAASGRKTRTERAFWDETGEPRNFAQRGRHLCLIFSSATRKPPLLRLHGLAHAVVLMALPCTDARSRGRTRPPRLAATVLHHAD